MSLLSILEPLLHGDVARWEGLPTTATVAEFDALFGAPTAVEDGVLGHYPATRRVYAPSTAGPGFVLWERAGQALMVEAATLPSTTVLDTLPEPCGVLPQEILVPHAYAHEHLYCANGLLLTVARALDGDAPDRIVRSRGIKPLVRPEELGPEYYRDFNDQTRWPSSDWTSGAGGGQP